MRQPDEYPKTLIELLIHPDRDKMVASLFEVKKAIENAVVIQGGVKYPLRFSAQNAVVDLDTPKGEASTGTVLPPVLALEVDDPNDELDLTITLPDSYDQLYLERSADGETFTPLATLAGNTTSYSDDTVSVGTEYFYRVKGQRNQLYSVYSNIVSGEVPALAAYAFYVWGYNSDGQLGKNNTTTLTSPSALGADTWLKVAAGDAHSLAVKSDGTLWSCGDNAFGQLGLNDTTDRDEFAQVGVDTDWADVFCGREFSVAVKANGDVYTCGRNEAGQLGLADTTNRDEFEQAGSGSTWIHVGTSEYNLLLVKNDNTLWIAGRGIQGQIGDGANSNRSSLTQCGGTGWLRAYGGFECCFGVKTDGTGWAWGYNGDGQLGVGSGTSTFNTPQQIGALTTWKTFSGGETHTVATKTDGTLWVAGTGHALNGQLGLGATNTTGTNFVQIGSATNWDYIVCGSTHTSALTTDGKIYSWGGNGDGALGVGDTTLRNVPTQENTTASTWQEVTAGRGGYHGLALKTP
jgi:alpha-tubulin suppressor-like RCC1 family protein